MAALVIINESHSLLPEQEELLRETFGEEWDMLRVPARGLTRDEMNEILRKDSHWHWVFVSPVPYMLAAACYASGLNRASGIAPRDVWLFHNSRREKLEINGKIIYRVPTEGWELIRITN